MKNWVKEDGLWQQQNLTTISDLNLMNPKMAATKYTWSNLGSPFRSLRLDRFSFMSEWLNKFPYVIQKENPWLITDNCSVIFYSTKFKWGPLQFRFENMRVRHENFIVVVEKKNGGRWMLKGGQVSNSCKNWKFWRARRRKLLSMSKRRNKELLVKFTI